MSFRHLSYFLVSVAVKYCDHVYTGLGSYAQSVSLGWTKQLVQLAMCWIDRPLGLECDAIARPVGLMYLGSVSQSVNSYGW